MKVPIMDRNSRIAVIDIGKTNAKVVLFDGQAQREVAVLTRSNTVLEGPPYPHFNIDGLWRFICASLKTFNDAHGFDAISITTHGATFALLDAAGELALPVLDYEYEAPGDMPDYDALRPPFAETGSPRLSGGLNAGAQIYFQQKNHPVDFGSVATILPYPQYWAYRLTGVLAGEVTSLGVHTDLWNPHAHDYSRLVDQCGWRSRMPVIRPAQVVLGPVKPDLALEIGFLKPMPVHSGIHDSNASLLPHLLAVTPPFAVVSTGTWVVCLAVGGLKLDLDEARDTLINVNVFGQPVPSARFMGGRAFTALGANSIAEITAADRHRVLEQAIMFLPSLPENSGPFPQAKGRWVGQPQTDGERLLAVSLYLALMTVTSLALSGARGLTIVEGPFAGNQAYLEMLGVMTGRPIMASDTGLTGTSFGAVCLVLGDKGLVAGGLAAQHILADPSLAAYGQRWLALAGR